MLLCRKQKIAVRCAASLKRLKTTGLELEMKQVRFKNSVPYISVFQPFNGCGTQNNQNNLRGTQITLKKTLRNPNFSKVTNST
jgi:hypothetical protein